MVLQTHDPRAMRRGQLALLLLTVAFGAGCYAYRPAVAEEVSAPAQVRIAFSPPETLVFYAISGDSSIVENVEILEGRLVEQDAASMTLATARADVVGESAPRRFQYQTTVQVAGGYLERQEVRRGRTVLLVGSLVGLLLLIAAAASADSPPPPSQKDSSSKSY